MQQNDFPPPPNVGLFTRFVLENPWPLTIVLLAIAAAALWVGLRDGRRGPMKVSGIFAIIGLAVLVTGTLITTPAEHGASVTRQLVDEAVAGEVRSAMALFAPDAAATIGSPRNPGISIATFESRLERLHTQYAIRANRIRSLRAFTEDQTRAVVHLACATDVEGYSSVPTQWVLIIERQPDGQWLISRLTFVSVSGMTPQPNWW